MQKEKSKFEWYRDHMRLRHIMRHTKKEKIYLFLDFDGVINVFYLEGTPEYEEKIKIEEFEFFDRDCVERLNEICHAYPIEIVLSTSWRYAGIDYCRDYLHKAGLDEDIPIVGVTEEEFYKPRQEEITDYLFAHPDFTGFLILDDGNMKDLTDYLVLTCPIIGLNEEKKEEAHLKLQTFMR